MKQIPNKFMTPATLCEQLFTNVDGYSLSFSGKDKLNLHTSAFTYGEVSPHGMEIVLNSIQPSKGVFYDLGSGTGKAVFMAAAFGNFKKSVGIELLPDLHNSALQSLKHYDEEIRQQLPSDRQQCEVEFRTADIFQTKFDDGDVIFCHCCTCFEEALMDQLEQHLLHTKSGCTIITVSRQLKSPAFTDEQWYTCPMGWGDATAYMYRRA